MNTGNTIGNGIAGGLLHLVVKRNCEFGQAGKKRDDSSGEVGEGVGERKVKLGDGSLS